MNWRYKVDLNPEWGLAKIGDVTQQELALSIYNRLSALCVRHPELRADVDLQDVVLAFRGASLDGECSASDVDWIMRHLCDWADRPIISPTGEFGRLCWINTFKSGI